MIIRKYTILLAGFFAILVSCNNDDDSPTTVPDRPKGVVYDEDIAEIEDFLLTTTYNYEDFDFSNPYSEANDTFEIIFEPVGNTGKTPLMDRPELQFKTVTDSGIDYKLYYLSVREGQGNEVHFCDRASVTYEGRLTDNFVFDSAVTPFNFDLITVGQQAGVVPGFQQGLIEFKTSTAFTDNGDGTDTYRNHGIGAIFIPSGLGYFSQPLVGVPAYSPLIFTFSLFERSLTDHDNDNIWSYLEDLNEDGDVYDDDTDGDFGPNFIDNDDDNDGYFTRDELDYGVYTEDTNMQPFTSIEAAKVYYDTEIEQTGEIFLAVDDNFDGTFTLRTTIILDSNNDGKPDYLDKNVTPE